MRGTIPFLGQGIAVGQYAEVERQFSVQEVSRFANLIHDHNLLHAPGDWTEALREMPHLKNLQEAGLVSFFDSGDEDSHGCPGKVIKPVVHGMLVSSLFSSIFGTLSPGCVYRSQALNFVAPVHIEELVLGRLEVKKVRLWRKGGVIVHCNTSVFLQSPAGKENGGIPAVKGSATVWLPSGHPSRCH